MHAIVLVYLISCLLFNENLHIHRIEYWTIYQIGCVFLLSFLHTNRMSNDYKRSTPFTHNHFKHTTNFALDKWFTYLCLIFILFHCYFCYCVIIEFCFFARIPIRVSTTFFRVVLSQFIVFFFMYVLNFCLTCELIITSIDIEFLQHCIVPMTQNYIFMNILSMIRSILCTYLIELICQQLCNINTE